MKGFKLSSNGDVKISGFDKIITEPIVYEGESWQESSIPDAGDKYVIIEKSINLAPDTKYDYSVTTQFPAYSSILLSPLNSYSVSIKLKEGKTAPEGAIAGLTFLSKDNAVGAKWVSNDKTFSSLGSSQTAQTFAISIFPSNKLEEFLDAFDIMVVEGIYTAETMPEYVPYTPNFPAMHHPSKIQGLVHTETKTGNESILHGLVECKDKLIIDKKNHLAKINRQCQKLTLRASMSWSVSTREDGAKAYFVPSTTVGVKRQAHVKFCTHFLYTADKWTVSPVNVLCENIGIGDMIIFVVDSEAFPSKATWTQFLEAQYAAGTPVEVLCQLAEPANEEIPYDEQSVDCQIEMISGDDLLAQTTQSVLGTNKGEWFDNENEGITFSNILGKQIDEEKIKNEVLQGLLQVDSSFFITEFGMSLDNVARKLEVTFTARNSSGNEIRGVKEWR